ncbi:NAD-dependent epimerase/dehydratase family protein [Microbacterium sp. CCNWLW134]|uniref:NAD-dependent epimerase/dehydratase family protein n=1 Tax=Microbacterium sp. CCNWLW134 TaxID=3122064 RepID=UPI00300FDDB9
MRVLLAAPHQMSTARWVIGRGLLGSAVTRQGGDSVEHHVVDWSSAENSLRDLHSGLSQFVDATAERLEIYWCAGKGVTSSPREQLDAELDVFRRFLDLLLELPQSDRSRLGFFLASSVGGAYAGSERPPFTETTPVSPASAYGATKIAMETSLEWATRSGGWRSFIARITNLYGPGQDLEKGQGLLSVIVASYLTRRPVSIFVSLDTLRDYIFEDDCARVVVAGMDRCFTLDAGSTTIKIVGAMAAQSIGAILGENRRLRGRAPLVILGQGNGAGQASDLRVRSKVWTDLDALVRTTLPEGLDSLYRAQLSSLGAGNP